jgi:hypothetical protein
MRCCAADLIREDRGVIVRTWLVNRIGALVPGLVVLVAATVPLFDQHPLAPGRIFGALILAVPTVYLVVRAIRAAVVLHDDRITIRGWWWSRTIPRDRVVRVSEHGWLIWLLHSGREMRSPLAIFWNYGDSWFGPLASHNEHAIATIRAWIERRDDHERATPAHSW